MTIGEPWLEHVGVDGDEYAPFGDLAHEVSDAMWDAAEEVLREWKARDPLLRVLADDRCGLWEWATVPAGTLPAGTHISYETRRDYRYERWSGRIRPADEYERHWHPERLHATWIRAIGDGQYNEPYLRAETLVSARLPIPFDLSALLTIIDAEEGTTTAPIPPPAPALAVVPPVTWADLQPGAIITYRHHSRTRRLAGQRMLTRRGRVEYAIIPVPLRHRGQISISVLNKDGSVNKSLGRICLPGLLDQVVSVERPAPVKENA